jgi:hypothetical protein
MSEPTTNAGRALLAQTSQSELSRVKAWNFTLAGMNARICRIEAEARAPLREALVVLQADAHDPERAAMWRYGVRHSLTIMRAALADTAEAER